MAFDLGQIVCFKTTGELATIIGLVEPGERLYVRRPIMRSDGITHSCDTVYAFELETPEEHLRREGKELVTKIRTQQEIEEEVEKIKRPKLGELVN